MSSPTFIDPNLIASLAAAETALEEAEREDLLAFALGQHREDAEIVDLSEWIHTAVVGKKNPGLRGAVGSPMPEYSRPPMLTIMVPEEVVANIHGDPKARDCMLLVHIKRPVLDSWLAQKEIAAGVQ